MTGNGLVKFEVFNTLNKLPWDDENDQFIIQVQIIIQFCFSSLVITNISGARSLCCLCLCCSPRCYIVYEGSQQYGGKRGNLIYENLNVNFNSMIRYSILGPRMGWLAVRLLYLYLEGVLFRSYQKRSKLKMIRVISRSMMMRM